MWKNEYGLRVYDLNADQICSLLMSPNLDKGKLKPKLQPEDRSTHFDVTITITVAVYNYHFGLLSRR